MDQNSKVKIENERDYAYENDFQLDNCELQGCSHARQMSQSHPVEEFHFPMEVFRYRTIKNCERFYEMLKKENIPLRRDVGFESTLITGSDGVQTLNIQCKQCEAYFKYIRLRKGEDFTLREYNQKHQHVLRQTQTSHQSIIERIEKFLQQEDGRQEKHELQADICINYRITSAEFQQLYSQAAERLKRNTMLYDGKQIDQLVKKLRSERFTVLGDYITSKIDREPRTITKSIVIINDQMTQNYKKYGEVCFIAVDDRRQINRWNVGGLMGIGRDLQMSLFGLFLMKTVDEDHLKGLLKQFLGSVEVKPRTIITQNNFMYDKAIEELESEISFKAQHLYDYAMSSEKLHRNNAKLRRIFGQLAREPQKPKFFSKLEELYNSQNFNEIDIDLQQLAAQSDKMCLSQIAPVPIGPFRTVRNKNTQKKNDFSVIRTFIKTLYEKQCQVGKHLYTKVKNILTLLLEPAEEQTAESNRVMVQIYPVLLSVRQLVSKNVMDYVMNKIFQTLQFRCKKIHDERYQVFEGKNFLYVLRKNQKWVCECQQSLKTMLPCAHQLLVCVRTNCSLQVQLGKRWTNEDERLQEDMRRRMYKRPKNKRVTLSEFLA